MPKVIGYSEMSCTEWFPFFEGGKPKELVLEYLNRLDSDDDDVWNDLAETLAYKFGDTRSDSESCEQCGHCGVEYKIEWED